jgi:3-oxoacyl-[acyl-carrier protein] reductase
VQGLIQRTLAEFGHIDILVNNAGISGRGFVAEMSTEAWDRVMAVNVRGPFLTCKYTLPIMMRQRQGNIINITSRASLRYSPGGMVYSVSKAALNRFSLNLAEEVKEYNIAVNALAPGLIFSYLGGSFTPSTARSPEGLPAEPPEVVVPCTVWLARQDAHTFSGQMVSRYDFGKTWGDVES